jgi:hypothetical protein
MTALQSNDLPAHFAPGAMAAAARWTVGGDADATPGSNGGSDTPPGAPDRPGQTAPMAMIGADRDHERSNPAARRVRRGEALPARTQS